MDKLENISRGDAEARREANCMSLLQKNYFLSPPPLRVSAPPREPKKRASTYRMPLHNFFILISILFLLLFLLSLLSAAPVKSVTVMTWNVENLFDADNDPTKPGAAEFTPTSWRRWTHARYEQKLQNLAKVIAAVKPDILFVQEIANRRVLNDLSKILKDKHKVDLGHIIHRPSPDLRIDTAILSRWEPSRTEWLTPTPNQREMVVATFDLDGAPVTFINCHWKSHSGNDKDYNTRTRTTEARALRKYVAENLKPGDSFVVGGDFNDDVDTIILTDVAELRLYEGPDKPFDKDALLHNLSGMLSKEARATFYYHVGKVWNSIDSFSVSQGMLPNAPTENLSKWVVVPDQYGPYKHAEYVATDGTPLPYRRIRTRTFDGYYLGASDHFPVKMVLDRRGEKKK